MQNILQSDFLRLDEVQILAYEGPHLNKNHLDPPVGMLVRITATTRSGAMVGVGEVRISAKNRTEAWTQLREYSAFLQGKTVKWRRKPGQAIADILATAKNSGVPSNNRSKPLKAIHQALEHLASQLGAIKNFQLTSVGAQRPSEEWPAILPEVDTSRDQIHDVDWEVAYPLALEFEVFPEASKPYRGHFNTYEEHCMPGAPSGVRVQTLLEIAALSAGAKTRRFGEKLFLAQAFGRDDVIGFTGSNSIGVSVASVEVSISKTTSKELLSHANVPLAKGFHCAAESIHEAEKKALEMGFPLVVKPVNGKKGYGVTTGINTVEKFREAFERASEAGFVPNQIMVEEEVPGVDFRIFATDEKSLSVIKREPAQVTGNGKHSLGQLITWASVIRRKNPHLARRKFLPGLVREILLSEGIDFDSIPAEGEKVWLARSSSLSQGGTSISVLSETHPSIQQAAVDSVRAFGLPYAGVDIILEDHRKPIDEQSASLIEVNTYPGHGAQRFPMYGESIDLQKELFEHTARKMGFPLEQREGPLTLKVTALGRRRTAKYLDRIKAAAEELRVSGWVTSESSSGAVEVVAHGDKLKVANLLNLVFAGFGSKRPVEVQAEAINEVPESGFRVIPASAF